MTHLSAAKARSEFDETLERAHGGERIVVRRGGKAVAAIVPVADLRLLEKLEDERDVALARERLAKKRHEFTLGIAVKLDAIGLATRHCGSLSTDA